MDDLDMVPIPAGTFLMGSSIQEQQRQRARPLPDEGGLLSEGPQHQVMLSAFECMRYTVTRRLYASIMGKDPLQHYLKYHCHDKSHADRWGEEPNARPVVWVRWLEAIMFCNTLSSSEGLAPCYTITGEDDPGSARLAEVRWDRACTGYRLPTEAEWEYACRAGTTTEWSHGDDESELARYAWFYDSQPYDFLAHNKFVNESIPHVPGEKLPNPWGLFDMHGNVGSWCYDAPRDFAADAVRDPGGDSLSNRRAVRGGCVGNLASSLRSAARIPAPVRTKLSPYVGFRCVKAAGSDRPNAGHICPVVF